MRKEKLVIVPEEAKISFVGSIWSTWKERVCCRSEGDLEKDRIPNGAGNRGWHETNIKQILTNEKYIGDALLQKTFTLNTLEKKRVTNDGYVPKYYVEGNHEAIIDKGSISPGKGGTGQERFSFLSRSEKSLQLQIRYVRPCLLCTLRGYISPHQME